MAHRGPRPGVPPCKIPRRQPRHRPPILPINAGIREGPVAVTVSRTPSMTSDASSLQASSSSEQGPTFFGDDTNATISGGHFHNHQGTSVTIHFASPNPLADGQQICRVPDAWTSPSQDAEGIGSKGIATTGSSQATGDVRQNTERQPEAGLPRPSNKIYESQLLLKGRGYPLWIPQPNIRLPIPYRENGIRIGDVGIITSDGSFDFLFNVCLPQNNSINPSVLPDGFVPIHPPLEPMDVREFGEFAAGSFLASSSVTRAYSEPPASGLIFESSGAEGAILTMPDGAYHEELSNISGFRAYIATHAKNWYKFVNGPRGREAKNGAVHVVVGSDKTTKWGMATFANHSQTKVQLKFRAPEQRVGSGCAPFWEHSAMAEVRVGPKEGENDELGATPERPLRNQSLFIRTLTVTLADGIWKKLDLELMAASQHKSSHSDNHCLGSGYSSWSHDSGGERSSSFSDAPSSQYGNQLSDKLPEDSKEDFALGSTHDSVIITDFTPVPYTVHPSQVLNQFLLLQKPKATMAITHDKDWYSTLTHEDTDFPDSSTLLQRVQLLNDIFEENGVVYLNPKGRGETSLSSEREQITEFGRSLGVGQTSLFEYLFGHDQEPNQSQILQNTIEDLAGRMSSALRSPVDQLPLPGHPIHHLILDDLLLFLNGELTYEDTQEESIPLLWRQLSSPVANQVQLFPSRDRMQRLLRLGGALRRRYSRLNLMDDLEDAIHCYRQAASISLPSKFQYQVLEANMGLASSIYQRYLSKRQPEDLITLKNTLEQQREFDMKLTLSPLEEQLSRIKCHGIEVVLKTLDDRVEVGGEVTSPAPCISASNKVMAYAIGNQLAGGDMSSSAQSTAFFAGQTSASIAGGQFINQQGARVSTHSVVNNIHHFDPSLASGQTRELGYLNAVQSYGAISAGGDSSSELIQGHSSATSRARQAPVPDLLKRLIELACGLERLHNLGIVVRDLRGDNMTRLLKDSHSRSPADSRKSRASSEIDDPRWLAPEVVVDWNLVSKHSDVWSFGMVCLEILSGDIPFAKLKNNPDVIRHLLKGNIPDRPGEAAVERGLSDAMWGLLCKCWQKQPESRPPITEVKNTLLTLQGHAPVAELKPPGHPAPPPPERHPSTSSETRRNPPSLAWIVCHGIEEGESSHLTSDQFAAKAQNFGYSLGSSSDTSFHTSGPGHSSHKVQTSPLHHWTLPPLDLAVPLLTSWNLPPTEPSSVGHLSHKVQISPLHQSKLPLDLEVLPREPPSVPADSWTLPPTCDGKASSENDHSSLRLDVIPIDSAAHAPPGSPEAVTTLAHIVALDTSGTILAGTLVGLLDRLITNINVEYRDILLTACAELTTPDHLFSILSGRFYNAKQDSCTHPQERVVVQLNILMVMKHLLSVRCLTGETRLLVRLRNFCQLAIQMTASETMKRRVTELIPVIDCLATEITPPHRKMLRDSQMLQGSQMKPYDLAIALTLLEGDKYAALTPADYILHLNKHPGEYVPHLQDSLAADRVEDAYITNNLIIRWTQDSILCPDTVEGRAETLRFFIDTAEQCRKLRNFSSFVAIVSALHSPPIVRLKLTRADLALSTRERLETLRGVLNPSSSHRRYRKLLKQASNAEGRDRCVPWLSVHLEDLRLPLQRHPALREVDGRMLIDLRRYVKFMTRIEEVLHYRAPDLESFRDQGQLAYLEHHLCNAEASTQLGDDFMKRSEAREPYNRDQRGVRLAMMRQLGFGI